MNQNIIDAGIALCEFIIESQSEFGGDITVAELKGSYREVTLKLGGTLLSMIYHPAVQDLEAKYCSVVYPFTGNNVIDIIDAIKASMAEGGYRFKQAYTFSWDCQPSTDYFHSYDEAWSSAHGCDQEYGQQFPQMEEDNIDYTV